MPVDINVYRKFERRSQSKIFFEITPENSVLCLPAVGRDGDERCVC
jgi:hypothetical protein